MAIKLSALLNKKQIPYWADFGTLLGIVRDKDIISWDDDVDFGYFLKDRDRLIVALVENVRHHNYHIHVITAGRRIRVFYGYDIYNEPYTDFYDWSHKSPTKNNPYGYHYY